MGSGPRRRWPRWPASCRRGSLRSAGRQQRRLRPFIHSSPPRGCWSSLGWRELWSGAALQWRAQRAFLRAARDGRAGPAVLGLIRPRIVMPADDGRYAAEERALIRAHEREHIARRDPAAAGLMPGAAGRGLVQSARSSGGPPRAAGPGTGLRRRGAAARPGPTRALRTNAPEDAVGRHSLAVRLLLAGRRAASARSARPPPEAHAERKLCRPRARPSPASLRPGRSPGSPSRRSRPARLTSGRDRRSSSWRTVPRLRRAPRLQIERPVSAQ